MTTPDETEWTANELAALRALRDERPVSVTLADRAVAALQSRGVLRRRSAVPRAHLPLAAAAALALFIGGYAAGQARGTRVGHELAVAAMTATPQDDPAALAFLVQRTGSAYVQALAALAAQQNGDPHVLQARESALNITEAALRNVAAITRDTVASARLVRQLQTVPARHGYWY